jgi:single-stranded DNA-specific DHH superfamily exonuclease
MTDLPKKVLYVEASISPTDISLPTLDILDTFRPYGIGNPPPLFLLEDVTISRCEFLGK